MTLQPIICFFEKVVEEGKVKNDDDAKIVVVFTITEIICLAADLFDDLVSMESN